MMKKWHLLLILVAGILTGCLKDKNQDREKIVEMTIYPEVGYGGAIMSQVFTEVLIFSESDNRSKRKLENIVIDGFNFDYERGYKYTFKAKKIWMANPPQDGSSVKYVFIGPLNKKKVITEDSEDTLRLNVAPHFVKYHPRFQEESDSGNYKVYDALLCQERQGEITNIFVLRNIENFDYEEGYGYILSVKKIITVNPYSERYVLLHVINKTEGQ